MSSTQEGQEPSVRQGRGLTPGSGPCPQVLRCPQVGQHQPPGLCSGQSVAPVPRRARSRPGQEAVPGWRPALYSVSTRWVRVCWGVRPCTGRDWVSPWPGWGCVSSPPGTDPAPPFLQVGTIPERLGWSGVPSPQGAEMRGGRSPRPGGCGASAGAGAWIRGGRSSSGFGRGRLPVLVLGASSPPAGGGEEVGSLHASSVCGTRVGVCLLPGWLRG